MLKKYKGFLGNFWYDDTEFKHICGNFQYIGTETDGSKIKIPKGIKDCTCMFANSDITTPPVIPEGVIDCRHMFHNCRLLTKAPVIPEGVTDYRHMFDGCKSLQNYSLITATDNVLSAYCYCPSVIQEIHCFTQHFKRKQKKKGT